MNSRQTLALACCFLALLGCRPRPPAPFDGSGPQLAEELALVRSALEEGHPGLHRYASKATVDSAFDAALTEIREPMSLREFQKLLSRTVGSVRDGHTVVLMPKDSLDRLDGGATATPFRVLVRDGELFVRNNLSDLPERGFLGAHIVSIQGHSVAEFLAEYRAIAPVEARNQTRAPRLLESARMLTRYLAILYGIRESYAVSYVPHGDTVARQITLAAIPYDELVRRRATRYPAEASGPPAEFTFLPGGHIGRLRITSFDRDQLRDRKIDFGRFLDESFQRLHTEGASGLVLDLRDNGGGTDEFGALVARHLIGRDFAYYAGLRMNKIKYDFFAHTSNAKGFRAPRGFARVRPGGGFDVVRHPNLGTLHPAEPVWTGPLVVLLNGRSFSTTTELISVLAENTHARFVGEEGGGAFGGNCSGPTPTLELPYSRLRVEIPLVRYEMAVSGRRPLDRGLIPDLEVLPTVEDVVARRDAELEAAVKMLSPPPGR